MQAERNATLAGVRQAEELFQMEWGVLYLQLQGQRIRRCPGIELAESVHSPGNLGLGRACFLWRCARYGWRRQQLAAAKYLRVAGTQHGYIPHRRRKIATNSRNPTPGDFCGAGVPRQEL